MSKQQSKKSKWMKVIFALSLLVLPTLIFYFFVYTGVHHVARLPFYGPVEVVEKQYHGRTIQDTVYHEIPPFELVLPDQSILDGKKLDGHIYIAHFLDYSKLDKIPDEVIFVAADVLDKHPDLYFITHIKNYNGQELPKPSSYTTKLAGRDTSWLYTIGPQSLMDSLHYQSYFVKDPDLETQKDPYSLVLIDKEKRIRGYYNPIMAGDSKRIKDEVSWLKKEYVLNYKTHRYYQYDDKIEQKRTKQ